MPAKRILMFGGSFDPPHRGHINLLENAIAAVKPDLVLVVPSGVAPHKRASATSKALRLAMCQCFKPVFSPLEVLSLELEREGKSFTVDTVAQLQAHYPGAEWFLCIGSDMLLSFTTWRRWQQLLEMVTLVVASRQPGEALELEAAADRLRQLGGRLIMAQGPVLPLSSSDIRAAIAAGRDMAVYIPPPADAIVKEHRLYQA